MDIRQVTAAFLTLSMFLMLANMGKRDHFDDSIDCLSLGLGLNVTQQHPSDYLHLFEQAATKSFNARPLTPVVKLQMELPVTTNLQYSEVKVTKQSVVSHSLARSTKDKLQWTDKETLQSLKPCWNRQLMRRKSYRSKGYITFSLTNAPESHAFQIADAVVVAKYLNATLVIPDIKGSKPEETRNFDEIYDSDRFIRSFDGLVNIVRKQPDQASNKNLARFVKIPNRITEDYITDHIEHLFKRSGNLRLEPYPVNMVNEEDIKELDSILCLSMFGTLYLQPGVQNVIDSMVKRLRKLSRKPNGNGEFVAVDFKIDMLRNKGCRRIGSSDEKSCYDAREISEFLNKIGYDRDTTVYLTQPRWDDSLNAFKEFFPKTYTKEGLIPADRKNKFLSKENSQAVEKVMDLYICAQSDVFVPTVSGPFYRNVAAKRIANGKTKIIVPRDIKTGAAAISDYMAPCITKKTHAAYSCFC